MYLKKIELLGFKSFADKTEVSFERGVTCIVGPNGCGKSNISDAIRWVLGERSPKLLRGSKMEDVIFSGTDFRKPLNFSEVSLTIDNSDQKLPIPYEEVFITRRLHRSGESEYLLNKTPCRLKDIYDLILDTGIGSNSYSMIEQGRIDYILNAQAEERRSLIEEAAGISKYKVKKEEAIRKLERTEENLIRLNDIVSEVERNIRYAERQAQRAERYKDQFEQLKKLETQKAFYEIGQIDQQLEALRKDLENHAGSLEQLEAALSEETLVMRDREHRLQQLEETFLEREGKRSEILQQLTSLENHQQFHRERIEFLKLDSEKWLREIESLNQSLETLQKEMDQKNQELSQINKTLSTAAGSSQNSDDFEKQQALLFDLATQISAARNTINEKSLELASLERAQTSLKETRTKLTEHEASLKNRFGAAHSEHADYETNLSDTRAQLDQTIQKQERTEAAIKNAQKEAEQFKAQITKRQSQLKLLEELEQVSGPDPKKIVTEYAAQSPNQGPLKALLDLVEIEPGYELAAEAALHDAVKGVVTEDAQTAACLLDRLKKSGSHQATIFIKDRAVLNGSLTQDSEANAHPLVQKRLWDVIRVQKGYEAILGNLLGKVYLIEELTPENIGQLIKLTERIKLVSKSGIVLGPEFQLSLRNGGYTPEKSALARSKEKERLEHEVRNLMTKEGFSSHTLKEFETDLEEIKKQRAETQERVVNRQLALERIESTSVAFNERLSGIREELEVLSKEEKQNSIQMEKLAIEKQSLAEKLVLLEHEERQMKSLTEWLRKGQELKKALELLSHQISSEQTRIQTVNQERAEAEQQIARLQEELADFQKKESEVRQTLSEHSSETDQIKRERAKTIEERNQILEEIQSSSKTVDEAKQKSHQYHLKQMEWNHQKQSVAERLLSRYKIALSHLKPEDYAIDGDALEHIQPEIEKLTEKIDAIGTVNLLAIEEYQEMKARYEFLLNQKRDLVESRDSLLEAIRKINRTTKKLFEETLVRVRENFHQYFRSLFGGGQADLILVDAENPTDSGLDIVARPPGKKLQHITLLSGGEKALTAIALLLALFSVHPSPFCVLDEVDAPLDEANNERFLQALKPFLSSTQFIMVTHSRKTIAMGDALYGVTMQEPGISKLVSVRLSHDQQGIEHTDQKLATELNQVLT